MEKVSVLHAHPLKKYLCDESLPFTLHFNEISKMFSFIRPTLCSSKHETRYNLLQCIKWMAKINRRQLRVIADNFVKIGWRLNMNFIISAAKGP